MTISTHSIRIDVERHEVTVNGAELEFPPKEFGVLVALAKADGKVLTRENLLSEVWGYDSGMDIDTRAIDQHLARIRKKMAAAGGLLVTIPSVGYKLTGAEIVDKSPRKVPAADLRKFLADASRQLRKGQAITLRVA